MPLNAGAFVFNPGASEFVPASIGKFLLLYSVMFCWSRVFSGRMHWRRICHDMDVCHKHANKKRTEPEAQPSGWGKTQPDQSEPGA